jgi:hypothetical protein
MAVFSVSALLAQDTPRTYCYTDADCAQKRRQTAACDARTSATTKQAMLNAAQALGVDQSATAVCWLRIAAAQGDATAQGTLAVILYTGPTGVPANPKEALEFAIKAANAHNYLGDTCLSLMYANGTVLEKDQAKSDFWRQAAERDKAASVKTKEAPAPRQTPPQSTSYYYPTQDARTSGSEAQTIPIPSVMHFCAQHCVTFTRQQDGTLVNYTNMAGQYNVKRVLTVEKFTPESVIIHRKDTGSHPGESMMVGRMGPGNTTASGQNWQLSWGDALDRLPESDLARAQRQGIPAPETQASPFALLFGLLVGEGNSGDSYSGGDLPGRISSLQDQWERAKSDCFRATARSGQPPNASSCDRQKTLDYQLDEARGELRDEINTLMEAHNTLAQDCNAGNNDACERQKQVDAQLSRDRQFNFTSVFR